MSLKRLEKEQMQFRQSEQEMKKALRSRRALFVSCCYDIICTLFSRNFKRYVLT